MPQAEWATEEVPETDPDRWGREEGQNVRQRKQTGHRQYADDKYDVIDGSQLQKSKLISSYLCDYHIQFCSFEESGSNLFRHSGVLKEEVDSLIWLNTLY